MSAEQPQQPAEPAKIGEKPPEQKKPPTIEELVANQQKQIDLLAQGIVVLNKKLEEKAEGGATGGVDVVGLIKALTGAGANPTLDFAKQAESFAKLADALQQYRNPVQPYSLGDRYLMRAGAMAVRRTVAYEGVKSRSAMREIDKELGFEGEGGEGGAGHVE